MSRQNKFRAFTLVELLVVIAIIGILIGMLLPAVQSVREAARRISCANQMRQMSLAMLNFESANQHFPPGIQTQAGDFEPALEEPGMNWYVFILPFVEQQPLADEVSNLTNGFTNPNNAYTNVVATTVVSSFICPSCPMGELNDVRPDSGQDAGKANYVGVWGIEFSGNSNYDDIAVTAGKSGTVFCESIYSGILFLNSEVRFSEISDGSSNTFVIAERDGAPIGVNTRAAATWCSGRESKFANQCLGPISGEADYFINTVEDNRAAQWNAISSEHPGGATFGRADGSVEFIAETIGGEAYEAFGTKAGGEVGLSF